MRIFGQFLRFLIKMMQIYAMRMMQIDAVRRGMLGSMPKFFSVAELGTPGGRARSRSSISVAHWVLAKTRKWDAPPESGDCGVVNAGV
jgi:hypothetical protein